MDDLGVIRRRFPNHWKYSKDSVLPMNWHAFVLGSHVETMCGATDGVKTTNHKQVNCDECLLKIAMLRRAFLRNYELGRTA